MCIDLWRWMSCMLCVASLAITSGCRENMAQNNSPSPKRDINAVLRDHDKELLLIPNVVGVYVGVIETTNKPCLKVMVARELTKSDPAIPTSIEGYPVVVEVTGEIRPLHDR